MDIVVESVDNCVKWSMSNDEVQHAFGRRLATINRITHEYRAVPGTVDENALDHDWPVSQFSPLEPKAVYVAHRADNFLGFLEATMKQRDYAKVTACVVMNGELPITHKMFTALAKDCVAMDIPTITVPRNWSDYTPNDKQTSARYNFNHTSITDRVNHVIAICHAMSIEYPYLYFKTPFKTQFIHVSVANVRDLDRFVHLFLNGMLTHGMSADLYRTYHVSLWQLVEPRSGETHSLSPNEADIVIAWQRKQIVHPALQFDVLSGRPLALFGKHIHLAPEHPDRLTVVACRHKWDIPPEAVRVEDVLWVTTVRQEPERQALELGQTSIEISEQKTRHERQQHKESLRRSAERLGPRAPGAMQPVEQPDVDELEEWG